jgi:hypothetical protein
MANLLRSLPTTRQAQSAGQPKAVAAWPVQRRRARAARYGGGVLIAGAAPQMQKLLWLELRVTCGPFPVLRLYCLPIGTRRWESG